MLGHYDWTSMEECEDWEFKGGKPNPGTSKDGRLKENQPSKKPMADDGDGDGKKPPFPGAAKPFKGGKGK